MPKKRTKSEKRKVFVWFLVGVCFLFTACGKEQEMYLCTEEMQEQETEGMPQEDTSFAQDTKEEESSDCYVYVCGAVVTPGVYKLARGSRIYEAVELAGGFLDTAAPESLNQALEISDGQMIQVLTMEEARQAACDVETNDIVATEEGSAIINGKVNLNAATQADLMTLPGIGASKAEAILSYRKENGSFTKTEDIKKIAGIKDGVYEKIKDCITVN